MSALLETHAILAPVTGAQVAPHRAGDVVRLELHATVDGDAQPRWPARQELQQSLGQSAMILDDGADVAATSPLGSGTAHARAWNVQLLLPPGEGSLGPFKLALAGADGADTESVEVPAVSVTMETVLEEPVAREIDSKKEAPELKAELTKVMAAPRGPWALRSQWPLGWIALALGLAAAFAWIAWKISKRPKRVAPVPPPEPAEVVARRRLAALASAHDLTRGEQLAFHVELADILRRYLSSRLGTDVTELTTDEVRRMLRGEMRAQAALALGATSHAGEARVEIVRVLTACDLVKFARQSPAPVECLELLRDVGRVVDMTTPTTAPAQHAAQSPPASPVAPSRAAS